VGTPREIIDRLNAALRAALADNRVSDTLRKQGWYPAASTPEEMTKRMSAEIAHWAKALPAVGLKPQ
jgi:tripartite-type tricarboxylate transporter receptor subunit TctC